MKRGDDDGDGGDFQEHADVILGSGRGGFQCLLCWNALVRRQNTEVGWGLFRVMMGSRKGRLGAGEEWQGTLKGQVSQSTAQKWAFKGQTRGIHAVMTPF